MPFKSSELNQYHCAGCLGGVLLRVADLSAPVVGSKIAPTHYTAITNFGCPGRSIRCRPFLIIHDSPAPIATPYHRGRKHSLEMIQRVRSVHYPKAIALALRYGDGCQEKSCSSPENAALVAA